MSRNRRNDSPNAATWGASADGKWLCLSTFEEREVPCSRCGRTRHKYRLRVMKFLLDGGFADPNRRVWTQHEEGTPFEKQEIPREALCLCTPKTGMLDDRLLQLLVSGKVTFEEVQEANGC